MAEERETGRGGHSVQVTVAVITLVGVLATAVLANIDKIAGLWADDAPSATPVAALAGTYTSLGDLSRRIELVPTGANGYAISESRTPWPWRGNVRLDGSRLHGHASFPESQAEMDIVGRVRSDGLIDIEYRFVTRGDGSPAGGRIDHHVWTPLAD